MPRQHKGIMKPKGQGGRRVIPTACAHSIDGRYMTAACSDGSIQLWDHNKHTFVSQIFSMIYVDLVLLSINAKTNSLVIST